MKYPSDQHFVEDSVAHRGIQQFQFDLISVDDTPAWASKIKVPDNGGFAGTRRSRSYHGSQTVLLDVSFSLSYELVEEPTLKTDAFGADKLPRPVCGQR